MLRVNLLSSTKTGNKRGEIVVKDRGCRFSTPFLRQKDETHCDFGRACWAGGYRRRGGSLVFREGWNRGGNPRTRFARRYERRAPGDPPKLRARARRARRSRRYQ